MLVAILLSTLAGGTPTEGIPLFDGSAGPRVIAVGTVERYNVHPYVIAATPRSNRPGVATAALVPARRPGELPAVFELRAGATPGSAVVTLLLVRPGSSEPPTALRLAVGTAADRRGR